MQSMSYPIVNGSKINWVFLLAGTFKVIWWHLKIGPYMILIRDGLCWFIGCACIIIAYLKVKTPIY